LSAARLQERVRPVAASVRPHAPHRTRQGPTAEHWRTGRRHRLRLRLLLAKPPFQLVRPHGGPFARSLSQAGIDKTTRVIPNREADEGSAFTTGKRSSESQF